MIILSDYDRWKLATPPEYETELEEHYANCPAHLGPCPKPEQCEMRGCLRLDPPLLGKGVPDDGPEEPPF